MSGRIMGGLACLLVALECVGRAVTGKNTVPIEPEYAWIWGVVALGWGISAVVCWFGRDA